jgi:hypothetical protein
LSRVPTLLLILTGLWLVAAPGRSAGQAVFSEDAVKAAYLHRFAAYIEWPPAVTERASFTIGVVGSNGVLEQLQDLLPAVNVRGRPAVARAITRPADVDEVEILYIASARLASARPLIAAASKHAVLIVTDDPGGLAAGGVINFVRAGKNVRFEVSQPAADRIGLKIDPALLAVAARVEAR